MIARQILAIVAPTVWPQSAALDLPPLRIGLYSARAARQLRDSAPGKHGCADDRLVCAQARVVALLRLDATIGSVIGGYVTYRLARKRGKETLERKFPARTLEKVYRIFGRWGLWGHRYRRLAAAAGAHGSISLCCSRNAIFHGKIPGGARGRPGCPIFLPGVLGGPLWTACAHGHVATWASGPHHRYRADCSGNRGSPSHSRKETQ